MRQTEERARGAAQARPVYLFHKVEIGRAEGETSAVEHDGALSLIHILFFSVFMHILAEK